MDYREALKYILSFTNYEKSLTDLYSPGNIDLERVRDLLERLGSPHIGPSIVHIAGTKGKGSTAAMIASALQASGYRAGLFTSPHLHTFRERIKVDDRMISAKEFALTLEEIRPEVEDINRKSDHGTLTTFEILTALALLYFRRMGVQMEVLEVGLGGRLDATNVVQPHVCAITSISRDHTELLGDTLAEIAGEKAGIIKLGSVVVTAPQAPEVDEVLARTCREREAERVRVGTDITWESKAVDLIGQRFTVDGLSGRYELEVPLLGDHQLENAATAVAVLEALAKQGWDISPAGIRLGFSQVRWPGRLEILSKSPLLVVDGAHNGYSARKLRESLTKYFRYRKAVLVIGVSADKNIKEIAREVMPMASRIVITRSRHPRVAPPAAVAPAFQVPGIIVEVADNVAEAVDKAYAVAGPDDLICATGSIFIVGEVMEAVGRAPAEEYIEMKEQAAHG
ncbi:MAG: bifunctional folylpolyglutamate synthase/dihydrofolate synthase [Dehalococcoidia bacterium]